MADRTGTQTRTSANNEGVYMDTGISRRSFIGLAGVGMATAAATGMLSGCDASAQERDETTETTTTNYEIKETFQADVVVVGGGGAGCSAATRSAELGLTTILVEFMPRTGGTSIMTEGLFAVGSHWQRDMDVDPGENYIFTTAMDYHHWLADGGLFRSFISSTSDNIDWMESVGISFKGVGTMIPTKTKWTWHLYETREGELSGAVYVEQWRAAVENAGAEVMVNTKAIDTIMEDGKVAAIICEQDGGYIKIETKAVIMATGGYGDNEDLVKEFAGFDFNRAMSMGMGGRTGLGIDMARKAGGALASAPGTIMFYGGNLPGTMYGEQLFCATSFQPLLWINEKGHRFVNEWYSENNFSFSGCAQSKQKKVYSILTQAQMDSFVEDGCIFGCGEYLKRGTKLTDLWKEYDEQVAAKNDAIFKADTLDELADMIGLDAETLKTTIETYNRYCAEGVDKEFSKDPEYLLPLTEGPFYAFDLKVGYFTTVGGMHVSHDAEVLNEDGEPIQGLYAAGCDAGGNYGDAYDVSICEGSQQAWCVHSGKKAAEHIATNLV